MSFRASPFTACLSACLSGLALASLSVPAFAQQVKARYSITLLGIPLGTATMDGDVGGGAYKVAVNAKLTGVAAMVSSTRGAATANGALSKSAVIPAAYANTSANEKETRTVRISMQGGAVRGVDISPPIPPAPDRVPLNETHTRNIIDPLSALIMPVPGSEPVVGPAACNRVIPVYDGFTRFDIALTYVGTRRVQAKGYSGEVAVCSVRYTPIAGHRNRKPVKFMAENKDIQVWLAPIGNSRTVVPFRISAATMVGTTVIEATEFGANLAKAQSL